MEETRDERDKALSFCNLNVPLGSYSLRTNLEVEPAKDELS